MNNHIKPKEQKILNQAQTLLSQNNVESARDILRKFSLKNKISHQTKYFLSLCNAILGNYDEAIGPAIELVNSNGDNIEYLKLLGSLFHNLKQYEDAIQHFELALQINPQDAQTQANIGSALIETKQYDKAETHFRQSIAIQPNQPDTLTNYGLLLQANARLDEAISIHKKALQYNPEHIIALYNLAHALNEKGDFDASLQTYLKIIHLVPNHVRALCDVARTYGLQKHYDKAIPYLERAREIAPDDTHVHLSIGSIYKMRGDIEKAKASFKEAIRLNPDDKTAIYHLATINGNDTITSSPDEYVEELFDSYAETFDKQLISELKYKTPELIANLLKKYIDEKQSYKILDLGCGTGLAGIYLNSLSDTMTGIDLSSKMLKKAEERKIYDELITIGIEQYFSEYQCNPKIVVSADVFVYIGDLDNIFKHVTNSIQDDGLFVFSTEDTQESETFMLRDSGRFAHNKKYISDLSDNNDFTIVDNEKTIIRHEAGQPIHGQIYLLKKL